MQNYQKDLDKLIDSLKIGTTDKVGSQSANLSSRPSLLLHACCGPCSSYVLEYLAQFFKITVLYYNPNIYPQQEYERRLTELKALYEKFPPVIEGKVELVEDDYDPEDFYKAVGTREEPELAAEKEKGERCRRCYQFRLRKAFDYAAAHEFDYFCTTLSISPFKDAEKINVIGQELQSEGEQSFTKKPRWLPSDFKKRGGFKRSLEISEEYGMYRQQYCGCIYSLKS